MPDPSATSEALSGLRVLLVAADAAWLEDARPALARAGAVVHTACDGQEGMYAFASRRPDMVVTWAGLPFMSGTAMAQAIRDINPDSALVMVVNGSDPQGLAKALAVKADAYVPAPAPPRTLLAAIGSCVESIRRQKELEQQRGLTELLLGGLPNPAVLLNRETRQIVLANARARSLGLDTGTVMSGPLLPMDMLTEPAAEDPFGPLASYKPRQINGAEAFGRIWDITLIPVSQHTVLHFAVDVTEGKRSEEALLAVTREKEQYRRNLEAIFQSIPDAILSVDTELRVIETNKSLEEVCGLGRAIEEGALLSEVPGMPLCECLGILRATLATRRPIKERRLLCSPGREAGKVLVANCAPLVDREGRFSGAVLVMRDITRLEQLEKTLRERSTFRNIVGKSEPMQQIYTLLEHLADVDATVLITGESGTGKELAAEAVHYGGKRSQGPLVKVNCSALSEHLLESELFGHVRGAFTGAGADKTGRFQAAEGGTVLLDEIGDITPGIQLKLLRFLESKEFERVGDSRTLKADVRVVAATNVDLMDKVRRGLFREDLYYRLKVMVIPMPPLRRRLEDLPLLMEHFLARFSAAMGKHLRGVSPEVLALLMAHSWPGNVREFKHVLEHAAILCPGGMVELEHLPPDLLAVRQAPWPPLAAPGPAPEDGRAQLAAALERTAGNKAKAARMLGISRCTLYRRLARLGLPETGP